MADPNIPWKYSYSMHVLLRCLLANAHKEIRRKQTVCVCVFLFVLVLRASLCLYDQLTRPNYPHVAVNLMICPLTRTVFALCLHDASWVLWHLVSIWPPGFGVWWRLTQIYQKSGNLKKVNLMPCQPYACQLRKKKNRCWESWSFPDLQDRPSLQRRVHSVLKARGTLCYGNLEWSKHFILKMCSHDFNAMSQWRCKISVAKKHSPLTGVAVAHVGWVDFPIAYRVVGL